MNRIMLTDGELEVVKQAMALHHQEQIMTIRRLEEDAKLAQNLGIYYRDHPPGLVERFQQSANETQRIIDKLEAV